MNLRSKRCLFASIVSGSLGLDLSPAVLDLRRPLCHNQDMIIAKHVTGSMGIKISKQNVRFKNSLQLATYNPSNECKYSNTDHSLPSIWGEKWEWQWPKMLRKCEIATKVRFNHYVLYSIFDVRGILSFDQISIRPGFLALYKTLC